MANSLTRFGRPQDRTALLPEAPILGHRTVTESSKNALFAHKNNHFELTYIVSGTLEWLINDELVVTRQNDILVTFPEDKLALLNGCFMVSEAYFMQVDLEHEGFLSNQQRELFNYKLRKIDSRKVSLSSNRSILFSKMLDEHEQQDRARAWIRHHLRRRSRHIVSDRGRHETPGHSARALDQLRPWRDPSFCAGAEAIG